jgi:hypothetical protein
VVYHYNLGVLMIHLAYEKNSDGIVRIAKVIQVSEWEVGILKGLIGGSEASH